MRITAPCYNMVKTALRAVPNHEQWTSPDPALLTEHLAPPVTSTSPEPMMLTEAVLVAFTATLPDPAIETSAVCAWTPLASMPPEPAISIRSALRPAGAGLRSRPIRRRELERLNVEHADVEAARPGDRAVERLALDLVDLMSPDPPMAAPRSMRNGDRHFDGVAEMPAGVEQPFFALRANDELAAPNLDHHVLEHLLRPARADRRIGAGATSTLNGPPTSIWSKLPTL